MKKRLILKGVLVCLISILLGCGPDKKDIDDTDKENSKRATEEHLTKKDTASEQKSLFSVSSKHKFSSPENTDIFKLSLTGSSILEGKITFEISDINNQTIFSNNFSATDLLYDGGDVIKERKAKEDTIVARIKRFFENENFISPAIDNSEEFDSDNSTKEIWEDIKSDKSSVGFMYSYGYEGTYQIAYSKKKRKILTYSSSD
jgi:hypothetical protein